MKSKKLLRGIISYVPLLKSAIPSRGTGGFCSHIIDYAAHEFSDCWHEHWYYSDFLWKILMHGRMYPISRMPHSYHMECIEKAGFEIQKIIPSYGNKKAEKKKISKSIVDYFKNSDLKIKSAIVVARKPA